MADHSFATESLGKNLPSYLVEGTDVACHPATRRIRGATQFTARSSNESSAAISRDARLDRARGRPAIHKPSTPKKIEKIVLSVKARGLQPMTTAATPGELNPMPGGEP